MSNFLTRIMINSLNFSIDSYNQEMHKKSFLPEKLQMKRNSKNNKNMDF